MSRYIQRKSKVMKQVYIIWERYPSQSELFPNMENPRKLMDVHKTMEGAILAEGLLVRNKNTYYSIEIKDIKE